MKDRLIQFLSSWLSRKASAWLGGVGFINTADLEPSLQAMLTAGITVAYLLVQGWQDRNKQPALTAAQRTEALDAERFRIGNHIKAQIVARPQQRKLEDIQKELEIYGALP
jgi:hypothetical protein